MPHLPTKLTGFTLLELMITSLLGALLLMGATAMFGLFMRNSNSTAVRKQINQEGQQVMAMIEFNLRNAQRITGCFNSLTGPALSGSSTRFVRFISKDGADTVFERATTSPAYLQISPDGGTNYHRLHSGFVVAGGGFTCNATSNISTVGVSFTLTYDKVTPSVSQSFQNTIEVRNTLIR